MNNIAKLSIGLVTTGAVATGAIFASSLLSKGKEQTDSEPLKIDSQALAVDWEKRNRSRVAALNKIFKNADEQQRKQMADIIEGVKMPSNPRFFVKENGDFHGPDDVFTAVHRWCQKSSDDEEKLPILKKDEICKL